jgi:hypothetical protein
MRQGVETGILAGAVLTAGGSSTSCAATEADLLSESPGPAPEETPD